MPELGLAGRWPVVAAWADRPGARVPLGAFAGERGLAGAPDPARLAGAGAAVRSGVFAGSASPEG